MTAQRDMEPNKTALERAFELAKSGTVSSVGQLKDKIRAEGYDPDQINGSELYRQLRGIIAQALKE